MNFVGKRRRLVAKVFSPRTKRHYYYMLVTTGIRTISDEGWGVFWLRFKGWTRIHLLERRKLHAAQPYDSPSIEQQATRDSFLNSGCNYCGDDYSALSDRISEENRIRLENLHAKQPPMISIDDSHLLTSARSFRFPLSQDPQVSMVIPVHDNVKSMIECLTSILKNVSDISYEVIVVDDDSTETTRDLLSSVQNIRYLRNDNKLGFLLSCNRGAESARGEFLLILNNGVQFAEDWLRPLVETFSKYENIGAVGPKFIYSNGRLREAGCRVNPDASPELIGLADDPNFPRFNYPREVEFCSADCLLLRTNKFRELGGFDRKLDSERCADIDLCFRLRQQGFRIFYCPDSIIVDNLKCGKKPDKDSEKQLVAQNRQLLSERWQKQIDELNRVRLIAYYLPQYHPIPENDLWWGKGFTEWTNVTKAQPNFIGHYQPHLPSDLGFYDLRNEEIMQQQAELAKRYGIYGFCYYYYWFGGKRLLELPLERMLDTGRPDIPFCLCWANESWTRAWDGSEQEILISQRYSEADDRAVIENIMRYMRRPNYIRVNGKPLLLIYRAGQFPDIKRTTDTWRKLCREDGIGEIHLVMEEAFEHAADLGAPSGCGFDASVERPLFEMPAQINSPGDVLNSDYAGNVYDYRDLVSMYIQKAVPGFTRFRSVIAGWDNTPRRQDLSRIFVNSSPGAYQAWLESIVKLTLGQNFGDQRIVFINAWNEWAEGAHLEPDQRFGHGFLEATQNALEGNLYQKSRRRQASKPITRVKEHSV